MAIVRKTRIAIVGAGSAGLLAARQLLSVGFDVLILEATNRHGGRVRELNGFGDFPIMLGAEHVQGRRNPTTPPLSFFNTDIATLTPSPLVEDAPKSIYAIDGTWRWSDQGDIDDAKAVLTMPLGSYSSGMSVADYLASAGISRHSRLWHLYETWIGTEYGGNIESVDLRGWELERDQRYTGDVSWLLKTSLLTVLNRLYFNATRHCIRFNSPVTNVEVTNNLVALTDRTNNRYECDGVLITVPLSILQSDRIRFEPELPAWKRQAIAGIGFGKGLKLIMKFRTRFWPDAMYECILRSSGFLWAVGKHFPGATNNILTAYINGAAYERLRSTSEQINRALLSELDAVFGTSEASKGFIEAHLQDWGSEEYFQGVYSYPIAATYAGTGANCRHLLALPVGTRIFFAGEATSSEHAATVHGALETGQRAAFEIIAAFQRPA